MPPPPPKLSSRFPSPTFLLLLLSSFLLLLFLSLLHHHSQNTPPPPPPHTQFFHNLFTSLSPSSNSSISSYLRSLTLHPHLAGTPSSSSASSLLLRHLRLSGLQTLSSSLTPLLSFPASSSLSLLHPNLSLILPLPLSEPADSSRSFVPPYHAFSPSGSPLGPAVFANYGRDQDYDALGRIGVSVEGCVVVVRRGVGPRGAVVEKAAENGAVGVLMYGDDKQNEMEGGVERGMVLVGEPGDLLTPGWGTGFGGEGERLGVEDEEVKRRVPRIPSMPVAAGVVREVVRRLGGPWVPEEWRKGGGVVEEWGGVGGKGGGVYLNFTYEVYFVFPQFLELY